MEKEVSTPAPADLHPAPQEDVLAPIPDEVHEQAARLAKTLLRPLPAEEG